MKRIRPAPGLLPIALLCALAARPLGAQISPSIYQLEWPEKPTWAETIDDIAIFERVDTNVPGEDVATWIWDSRGRIKVERESTEPLFTLAYKAFTTDTSSDIQTVDGQLNDVAVVGAGRLGELLPGWSFHIMAGMGTANDGHWSNTDALYAAASVDGSTSLGEIGRLHLGLFYDGNAGLLPDVPLPYVAWAGRVSDELNFVLGTSETRVVWQPTERWWLAFGYDFPVSVDVWFEHDFFRKHGTWLDRLGLFLGYSRVSNGFYRNGLEHRRTFYEHDRVHAGIRWAGDYFDICVGGGYAFRHRFSLGWDIRDLQTQADLDDGFFGYIRLIGAI